MWAIAPTSGSRDGQHPSKLVLAVPVAAADSLKALRAEADEVVCLGAHEWFGAIGFFYSDFSPVPDETVIDLMRAYPLRSSEASARAGSRPGEQP
jgi:predicted phosphoribosyltransferase